MTGFLWLMLCDHAETYIVGLGLFIQMSNSIIILQNVRLNDGNY